MYRTGSRNGGDDRGTADDGCGYPSRESERTAYTHKAAASHADVVPRFSIAVAPNAASAAREGARVARTYTGRSSRVEFSDERKTNFRTNGPTSRENRRRARSRGDENKKRTGKIETRGRTTGIRLSARRYSYLVTNDRTARPFGSVCGLETNAGAQRESIRSRDASFSAYTTANWFEYDGRARARLHIAVHRGAPSVREVIRSRGDRS